MLPSADPGEPPFEKNRKPASVASFLPSRSRLPYYRVWATVTCALRGLTPNYGCDFLKTLRRPFSQFPLGRASVISSPSKNVSNRLEARGGKRTHPRSSN